MLLKEPQQDAKEGLPFGQDHSTHLWPPLLQKFTPAPKQHPARMTPAPATQSHPHTTDQR